MTTAWKWILGGGAALLVIYEYQKRKAAQLAPPVLDTTLAPPVVTTGDLGLGPQPAAQSQPSTPAPARSPYGTNSAQTRRATQTHCAKEVGVTTPTSSLAFARCLSRLSGRALNVADLRSMGYLPPQFTSR